MDTNHVAAAATRPRALIVEDVPTLQKLEMLMMETAGFTSIGVVDGQEAIELAGRERFDVILMDIHMPRMNGVEATRAIRVIETRTGEHVPIVFITAESTYAQPAVRRAAGADAYVPKPVKYETLIDVLGDLRPGNK